MKFWIAIACVLTCARQGVADEHGPPTPAEEPSAADVTGAPAPGDESGRVDTPESDSGVRRVGRAALAVPRTLLEISMAPVRAGIWVNERYALPGRLHDLFFMFDDRLGIYPYAQFESGAGVLAGVGLSAQLTSSEKLAMFAGLGDGYRERASATLRSGGRSDHLDRFDGRLALQLDGEYEKRPRDRFFGIGNGDEGPLPEMPIDPTVDDTATETRFQNRRARARATGDVAIVGDLHARAGASVTDLVVDRSTDGPPIDDVFMRESLVGFGDLRYAYGELAVRWDSRGRATLWEPFSLTSRGWLIAGWAGRVATKDGTDYSRYGIDLQRFFRIDDGPRVLAARFHGEAVSGTRTEVPFFELPALGGSSLLRGYDTDRFRDRVAAVGSLEYQWDLSARIYASVFVDTGRVFPSLADATLYDLRSGFGTALEARHGDEFWLRVSLASSIDGGAFLNLTFNPVSAARTRVERR